MSSFRALVDSIGHGYVTLADPQPQLDTVDQALSLMSNLSIASRHDYETKFQNIKFSGVATCEDLPAQLSFRMPDSPLPVRIAAAAKYLTYQSQARKILLDANEWEVKLSWKVQEHALKHIAVPTGHHQIDADNWETSRIEEAFAMDLDED